MKKLKELKFRPYPISNIYPTGWFEKQLRIQAAGLSGHLDEFWPDVKDSAWFGGNSEGWERAPYWLDGVMPLAYLLRDEKLIKKVDGYVDYIIRHQHEDGWLGPKESNVANPEAKEHYDIWAQFLALKTLVQYYEITNDSRILKSVEKGLRKIDSSINWTPLFDWGQARWFEAFISIFWLYEIQPQQWLLNLAVKLQAQGFGWNTFFKDWPMTEATDKGDWNFMGHVVNNVMAIKAYGLVWRMNGEDNEKSIVDNMINLLDKYHGTAIGTVTGDECLGGKKPTRGTELCSIVEQMFSLENLIQIFGDIEYSDRLEKIAFNALPGAFTRDMWTHQYDQQINQVECSINENMPWCTNDPDANIFGLEPHFGCCTSNFHQGWPKLASNIWMQTDGNGIAVSLYLPSQLKTEVSGVNVDIELKTEYPFRNQLNFILKTEREISFPLYLRIPKWCKDAEIEYLDKKSKVTCSTGYLKIDEKWFGTTEIKLKLNMGIDVSGRYNNAVSFSRGPLVYALKINEKREIVNTEKPYREFPHCDYEMYPKSNWNYAVNLDSNVTYHDNRLDFNLPFNDQAAPCEIIVKAKKLDQWKQNICVAEDCPESPVLVESEENEIRLIPFGCTHLRISEFPHYLMTHT